jgi:peptide deformylase
MIREVVHYDAPVLRAKGREVREITPEIRTLVTDLLDSMRHAHGVGLAAQQIGVAMQVAVIDVTGVKERPSQMWIAGQAVDPEEHMPLILINPVLKPIKKKILSHEGCLSFPGLTLDIARDRSSSRQAFHRSPQRGRSACHPRGPRIYQTRRTDPRGGRR